MSLPGIPEEYTISEPELRSMVRESRNGGNFAANLTWNSGLNFLEKGTSVSTTIGMVVVSWTNRKWIQSGKKCVRSLFLSFSQSLRLRSHGEKEDIHVSSGLTSQGLSQHKYGKEPRPLKFHWNESRVNKNGARKWVKIQKEKSFKLDLD